MEKTASHVDAAYAQEVNFKFRTGTSISSNTYNMWMSWTRFTCS